MAFDTGTIQTLGVLKDTLEATRQSKEAEKDRALQMLNLRLRSADAEANRLQNQQQFYGDQVFQLSKSLSELTGKVPEFEKTKNATGEGRALLEETRGSIAADLQVARDSLSSTIDRKDQLLGELNQYFQAANVLAPEVFDAKRQSGGTKDILGRSFVEGDEFASLVADFEAQGNPLSDTQKAGLQRALNVLGQQRFDNSMKEQELNLRRMNAIAAQEQAKSKGISDALDIYKDQWNQYRQFMMGAAETLELDKTFFAKLPSILNSASDVTEGYWAVAEEITRLAKEGEDWWRTNDKISSILDRHSDAKTMTDRRKASNDLIVEFMRDPELLASNFEFEKSFTAEDETKLRYFQDMLRGVQILTSFEDTASQLKPETYQLVGTGIRGLMSGTSQITGDGTIEETPSPQVDSMELASKFGNAFLQAAKNPKQSAPDDLLSQIRSQDERSSIKISDDLMSLLTSLQSQKITKSNKDKVSKSLASAIKEAKLNNIITDEVAKTYGSRLSSGESPKSVAKDFAFDALQALGTLGMLSTRINVPGVAGNMIGGNTYRRLNEAPSGIPTGPAGGNIPGRPMGPEVVRQPVTQYSQTGPNALGGVDEVLGLPQASGRGGQLSTIGERGLVRPARSAGPPLSDLPAFPMPAAPGTGGQIVPYSLQELIRIIRERNLLSK